MSEYTTSGSVSNWTSPPPDAASRAGDGPRAGSAGGHDVASGAALGIHGKLTATRPSKSAFSVQLAAYVLQQTARGLLPKNRALANCLNAPIAQDRPVHVHRVEDGSRASYAGLQTCGLGWVCSCCSCRKSEESRSQLAEEIATVQKIGGSVALATYTVRHHATDTVAEVLGHTSRPGVRGAGFLGAQESMTSTRAYKAVRACHGLLHSIKGLEVTYGHNGPHPHCHTLLFSDRTEIDAERVGAEIFPIWHDAAARFGFDMSPEYGLTVVRTYGEIQDYIAKHGYPKEGPTWGVESEMTKSRVKRRRHVEDRVRGYSPWELLQYVSHEGYGWQGRRFQEHAEAFKGKAQLQRSRHLRKWLGLPKDHVSADVPDRGALWEVLNPVEWFAVRWAGERVRVLELACRGDRGAFREYIDALYEAYCQDYLLAA